MTTTIETIGQHFEQIGWRCDQVSPTALATGFETKDYRDAAGEPNLQLRIEVADDGAYVRIFAPLAFRIAGEHAAAAFEACLRFQWAFRLVRLEYDHKDGELCPTIHLPIRDGSLTAEQVGYAISMMGRICDRLCPLLGVVLETGVIPDFDNRPDPRIAVVAERLSDLTPDQLSLLLEAVTATEPTAPSSEEAA